VLINSILDALPTYLMSVFPLPAKVEERIDALRRNFLWHGEKEYKGFHLVEWKTLLLSKKQGGLAIKNLRKQNKSLLMKWLWRFPLEEQSLWGRVIQAKYGKEGPWKTKEVTSTYGTSLWRSIRNLWHGFYAKTECNVNNGRKIRFWEDNWLGNGSLKRLFPDIHHLNQQQESTLYEVWSEHGWNLTYRRLMQDWEVERLAEFYGTLYQFLGFKEGEDTLKWKCHNKSLFTVSSAYRNMNHMGSQVNFLPWKLIWKVKIPYKVVVFTWLVVKEAVLTQENLMKRGIQMCPRCCFCEQVAETINHLFLHCKVVGQLWNLFTSFRGISWTVPGRTGQALESWNMEGSGSTDKSRWKIVPAVIWWTIWKERNSRNFDNKSSPLHKIKMNCIITFCYWCSSEYIDDPVAIVDILGSL